MIFTTPSALWLLLLILPVVGYLGFPRNPFRRVRDGSSLFLRFLLFILLVMSLAGAQLVQSANRSAVVFLIDSSDSLGGVAQASAEAYIRQSLQTMRPDDLAGIIVFGAEAQVVRTMSNSRELAPIRSQPNGGNSNIEAAIRLGLALLPEDAVRRMVIFSDGLSTVGDALNAAQLAQSVGIEIDYILFERTPVIPDVEISAVDVPPRLNENQEFNLIVTLTANYTTDVTMRILSSDEEIYREVVTVREGENNYTVPLRSGESGFRDFKVQIDETDRFFENNTLSAFTRVEGIPRILVVTGENGEENARYIVPALEENGLEVTIIPAESFPTTSAGLALYDSVILVNVPATRLTNQRMENLRAYISDLGGGLVVIGGDNAYGLGGYYRTPLEDVLPVEMQIKDQERLPRLTIAYMIDRSGSMGALTDDGIPYIELAKEAIIRSLDFLQPTDRAAVGSFDNEAYWIAPFQDVEDRVRLQRQVGTLRASGGTSIIAGMRLVSESIVLEPAEVKHIILLTDGGANSAGLIPLTQALYEENGVTVSVISIGADEASFLPQMAQVGGGNYHRIPDASSIPSIFTLETVLATRSYIQEQPFTPTTFNHPILQGIDGLPTLYGYVATTPRPAAQVVMRGFEPFSDPILATWQYGLGRTVAFTSDATSRWGADWVSWDGFSRFWGQTIRWTITEGRSENLETRVVYQDGVAQILVDARDDEGRFLNGLALQSNVVYSESPDNSATRVILRQVAPGSYVGEFIPQDEGAYFLRMTNTADGFADDLSLTQTTGWVLSYSDEYRIRDIDETLLENIAQLTGGIKIVDDFNRPFELTETKSARFVPIAPLLLLLVLILLPFDIAVRRLIVTMSDIRRLMTYLRRNKLVTSDHQGRLATLRSARDRVRASATIEVTNLPKTITSQPTIPANEPQPPVESSSDASAEETNIGARLLQKKRQPKDTSS
ncbi:MAG: VWA domain-containing protein [Anaerolineae bacterium]|jgi:uncharacterized membrane protein|nr:VWA domain-containing protein [Anaerolineae bacterium]